MGNIATVVFRVPFALTGINGPGFERHYALGSRLLE